MTTTRAGMKLLALLAAGGVALVASAPSRAATNLAPNPGFELNCSGTPCNWVGGAWSTASPHSGAASIEMTKTALGDPFSFIAFSDCVAATAGTAYAFSTWYRTAAATITQVSFRATYYSSADCTGSNVNTGGAIASATTNGWHQISGTASSPPGTQSATLLLRFGCADPGCPVGATGSFDDLDMKAQTTAVALRSATASLAARGVLLRWHTASEASVLGFNVYRQTGNTRVRVNARLIPAATAVPGRRYSFLDRTTGRRKAIRYWIQAVNADGSSLWHGPVVVQRGGNGREQ